MASSSNPATHENNSLVQPSPTLISALHYKLCDPSIVPDYERCRSPHVTQRLIGHRWVLKSQAEHTNDVTAAADCKAASSTSSSVDEGGQTNDSSIPHHNHADDTTGVKFNSVPQRNYLTIRIQQNQLFASDQHTRCQKKLAALSSTSPKSVEAINVNRKQIQKVVDAIQNHVKEGLAACPDHEGLMQVQEEVKVWLDRLNGVHNYHHVHVNESSSSSMLDVPNSAAVQVRGNSSTIIDLTDETTANNMQQAAVTASGKRKGGDGRAQAAIEDALVEKMFLQGNGDQEIRDARNDNVDAVATKKNVGSLKWVPPASNSRLDESVQQYHGKGEEYLSDGDSYHDRHRSYRGRYRSGQMSGRYRSRSRSRSFERERDHRRRRERRHRHHRRRDDRKQRRRHHRSRSRSLSRHSISSRDSLASRSISRGRHAVNDDVATKNGDNLNWIPPTSSLGDKDAKDGRKEATNNGDNLKWVPPASSLGDEGARSEEHYSQQIVVERNAGAQAATDDALVEKICHDDEHNVYSNNNVEAVATESVGDLKWHPPAPSHANESAQQHEIEEERHADPDRDHDRTCSGHHRRRSNHHRKSRSRGFERGGDRRKEKRRHRHRSKDDRRRRSRHRRSRSRSISSARSLSSRSPSRDHHAVKEDSNKEDAADDVNNLKLVPPSTSLGNDGAQHGKSEEQPAAPDSGHDRRNDRNQSKSRSRSLERREDRRKEKRRHRRRSRDDRKRRKHRHRSRSRSLSSADSLASNSTSGDHHKRRHHKDRRHKRKHKSKSRRKETRKPSKRHRSKRERSSSHSPSPCPSTTGTDGVERRFDSQPLSLHLQETEGGRAEDIEGG